LGPITPKPLGAALELSSFPAFDGVECLGRDSCPADRLRYDDAHVTLTDGAHGQLGQRRDAELAHDDHIQWSVEGSRHLRRYPDPAAR
jgi:hypothetical protein